MSGGKEIRSKIASIKNTQKITKAMEMVAASKMRKTQDRMNASKPYASRIYQVIKHLARSTSEYRHSFLQNREVKRAGVIVVTTDRGLCGGLNANLFKEVTRLIKQYQDDDIEIDVGVIGRKGEAFFRRTGGNIVGLLTQVGDTPNAQELTGVVKIMLDAYEEGKIDALHVVYNEFVNTMTQKPLSKQLLPLPVDEQENESEMAGHWDYIYEPDAKELLDELLARYIESQVYQAVIENIACEQAAKMMAMKSATDNAGELIKEFQLAYNKARQAAITQELAEIVGGAAAL